MNLSTHGLASLHYRQPRRRYTRHLPYEVIRTEIAAYMAHRQGQYISTLEVRGASDAWPEASVSRALRELWTEGRLVRRTEGRRHLYGAA